MKMYRRHHCQSAHRSYRKFVQCCIPRAAWVTGEGPWALIAWCHVPTVTLWADRDAAVHEMEIIDRSGCGHACQRDHEIVELHCPSARPAPRTSSPGAGASAPPA